MRKIAFIFSLICLIIPVIVNAQTNVSGNITSDTTWAKNNSPYVVTGVVNVYPGATLTIEAGVVVKMDSSVSIKIGGELIARGTETDSIIFKQNNAGVRWGTIKFLDSSVDATFDSEGNYINGSIIEYSRIEGAGNSGIYLDNASPFILKNKISGNSASLGGGIYCDNHSSPTISGNNISNNSSLYLGGGIYCYYSSPTISLNTISGNSADYGGGIYCDGSSPTISLNTISGNSADYGGGIYCDISSPIIYNNTISGNSADFGGGIYCNYYSSPEINYNNIFNNNVYDAYIKDNTVSSIDAKNNWWGTADKDSISSHIYDRWDDMELGKIYYEPFLLSATPINITSLELKMDDTYSMNITSNLSVPDTFFIELNGTDGDESHQDTTIVYVTKASLTDSIFIKLIETSLNTRIYRGVGYIGQVTEDINNIIGVVDDDIITIISAADTSIKISVIVDVNDPTGISDEENVIPNDFKLYQNYPNPFNPETTIRYALPTNAEVSIKIYDITGKLVRVLESGQKQAGEYAVSWDGRNTEGIRVASGIYFYRLEAFSVDGVVTTLTNKMTLIK